MNEVFIVLANDNCHSYVKGVYQSLEAAKERYKYLKNIKCERIGITVNIYHVPVGVSIDYIGKQTIYNWDETEAII